MKGLWPVLLLLSASALVARDRIGDIEFFGYKGVDVDAVRKALPVKQGDPLQPQTSQQIRDVVKRVTGHDATDVRQVCCDKQGDMFLYIGLAGRCESHAITGNPDPKHLNTSYIERHNLSVRMTARRFTRLTNAFSKRIENHIASVALTYFAYNFIKIHRTLRTTPAMASGVTDRLWEVSDLVAAWEAEEKADNSVAA